MSVQAFHEIKLKRCPQRKKTECYRGRGQQYLCGIVIDFAVIGKKGETD